MGRFVYKRYCERERKCQYEIYNDMLVINGNNAPWHDCENVLEHTSLAYSLIIEQLRMIGFHGISRRKRRNAYLQRVTILRKRLLSKPVTLYDLMEPKR